MKEIVFAGFGGQGVLTAGLVISQIAVHKGSNATWIPSYGSAMRGGTANCTVKYGEDQIYNPSQEEPDILLAMNNPSLLKFIDLVAPGGTIIVNSDMVTYDDNIRNDVKIVEVPCSTLAKEINHPKGANIIMAGVIAKITEDFTQDEGIKGMNDMFRKKGKEKFEEMNTKAFKMGYDFI
ncbi:2-oxoacid:acceptor oxidoreductase family protein [Wukongibacter baidiensis]|uniref:2-oxoacid:acceptor oxidoreductase family protein n=1 Tax=Wukongibacter baidiensis TaxID=1723361 RepID=UPI003D7FA746